MPSLRAVSGSRSWTGWPSIRISPLSGEVAPHSILTSVDLPAPLSPTIAEISPARMLMSTPSTALIVPNDLRSPTASITTLPSVVGCAAGLLATLLAHPEHRVHRDRHQQRQALNQNLPVRRQANQV